MLFSCGKSKDEAGTGDSTGGATASQSEENNKVEVITGEEKISVESCRFSTTVTACDSEVSTLMYPATKGKVYVDAVILVDGNKMELTASDFAGTLTYSGFDYEFKYSVEEYTGIALSADNIPVNSNARVHMFALVPEEAMNGGSLTANLTVCGQKFDCAVDAMATGDALSSKKELKAGDKETLFDGALEIEVVECTVTKYLTASDKENSQQYSGSSPFIDCVVKVTNKSVNDISDIYGYINAGDSYKKSNVRIETANNTALTTLDSANSIKSGTVQYVHIFSEVAEDASSDVMIRFNLGGKCFYVKSAS